jgi:type I restriction enzyme S subunit
MSRMVTLGEVLLGIEAGKSFQTSEVLARDDELGVLKVSAVTWSAFRPEQAKAVPGYKPEEHHRVRSGDLLISRANTRELVGAVVLVERDYPFRILSDKTLRLVINARQASKAYLLYALRTVAVREHIEHLATGTSDSMRNIAQDAISSIPIVLPPIEQQEHIASRLKARLAIVRCALGSVKDQASEFANLTNAIVAESMAHPNTSVRLLGDVLKEVKQGIGRSWADQPVLGATRDGLAPAKEPVGKNPERYKPVLAGTVFYNPMRILIGSIAMVDDDDTPGITSPDYVVLRGLDGVVDSRWFYYWLRSTHGEHVIASLARGAVRERMLFSRLAEGAIELPPYAVQLAASRVLAEVRPLKARIEAQLREIELLPARLLAEAFKFTEEVDHD